MLKIILSIRGCFSRWRGKIVLDDVMMSAGSIELRNEKSNGGFWNGYY